MQVCFDAVVAWVVSVGVEKVSQVPGEEKGRSVVKHQYRQQEKEVSVVPQQEGQDSIEVHKIAGVAHESTVGKQMGTNPECHASGVSSDEASVVVNGCSQGTSCQCHSSQCLQLRDDKWAKQTGSDTEAHDNHMGHVCLVNIPLGGEIPSVLSLPVSGSVDAAQVHLGGTYPDMTPTDEGPGISDGEIPDHVPKMPVLSCSGGCSAGTTLYAFESKECTDVCSVAYKIDWGSMLLPEPVRLL